ncbi:MAG: TlpA family protein disulfide reductase [Gemmatimonadota bacterium]|nr:TlpA family protein disulfide reductase [Gemmatimonadota bacterium]MDH3424478.1 TlpA family protein disulfide reductase [Gemmatimonadota bacterium]
MNRLVRSPYLWLIIGVVAVVTYAWTARDRYRESAILAGAQAPDFSFPSLTRGELRLSDFEDHVVLVNIWATWCLPCREEMPSMERLYEAFEGEDFEIFAVSVDAPFGQVDESSGYEGGDLAAFAHEYELSFPILHDPTGGIRQMYQTTGVPESFVIAKGGVIWKKVAGPTEWDLPVNKELIRRLLDG